MDTVWLAEAYPWWRKHRMEARSLDRRLGADGAGDRAADDRLGDHLAVHAPSGAGGDGRARRAGGGRAGAVHPRLRDVEDLPQQRADADEEDARADAGRSRDRPRRARRRGVRVRGRHVGRVVPALSAEAHTPREVPPVYVAATAPKMHGPRRRDRRRLPDAVDHDPGLRAAHARATSARRSTSAAPSSPRSTRTATRAATARARSRACTSPTRCRTSRAPPTRCSTSPGSTQDEIRPVAEAMEQGGRLAAKAKVTDAILDKCKPIAGTPGRLHRRDRGVPRRRLHPRHARAVGRRPARPDPALRREGAAAFPRLSTSSRTPAGGSPATSRGKRSSARSTGAV